MKVRALTSADAAAIAAWRYPGRYATYDCDRPADLAHDHWAVTDERGEFLGYCAFGAAARVAGAAPVEGDGERFLVMVRQARGQGAARD